ncbi:hypothetical protein LAV_00147 [Sphingobium phage Lacusarx]|uniref:Uncharacterized protein n=1 Tax=Sphingobium phage Lacusarx TaxID=1980139 RepID=A0A1W6DXM6_9CAUD|nr:hypothetical protein FDH44_gp156 [Sphingobium phage Lacusarx]ARK07522.1 hypothetical protein LAV_00147 [Sphingobium phage Lacusarx]
MASPMAEYDAAAAAEVACWPGAKIDGIVSGKLHRKTFIRFGTQRRFVVSPRSAGDKRRGPMRHCNDIRRVLRELGATRSGAL